MRQVNQWLSLRERLRRHGDETGGEVGVDRNRKRSLTIRVQKRASVRLREAVEPVKGLKAYLVLPPEDYAVLDPKWIQRDPEKGPSAFVITVPLDDLLGIDLTPKVSVRVNVNEAQEKVTFVVDRFSLGRPDMDKFFKIRVRSSLYSSNGDRLQPFSRFRQGRMGGVNSTNVDESEELESVMDDVQDLENLRKAGVPLAVDSSQDSGGSYSDSPVVTFSQEDHLDEHDDVDDDMEMDRRLTCDGDNDDRGGSGLHALDSDQHACHASDRHPQHSNAYEGDAQNPEPSMGQKRGQADLRNLTSSSNEGWDTSQVSRKPSTSSRLTTLLPELDGDYARLHCRVQLKLVTVIPPALSFIPNLVLGSVGRIILRAVLNALIPNFLDLVTNDYKRWVRGERKTDSSIGALVPDSRK